MASSSCKIVKAGKNSYYVDLPSKIGIYERDKEIYLIDSGCDVPTAEALMQIIEEKSWKLAGIINTHSHADHIGGNAYFQAKTGCDIFATEREVPFIKEPVLEPMSLSGGMPMDEIRCEFLMAEKSFAKPLEDSAFPKELEVLHLPGHSYDMVGIRTPDNVFFAADSIANPRGLRRYRMTYMYDVKRYIETLQTIKDVEAELFVPSHGKALPSIDDMADFNTSWIEGNIRDIVRFTSLGKTEEDIVKCFFDKYSLQMDYVQYFILKSTVVSYLTYLKNEGKTESYFKDNKLFYKS
jgi:glyoxylase-like metal-dependent hydrolase (beta-lactamase superfamily II)